MRSSLVVLAAGVAAVLVNPHRGLCDDPKDVIKSTPEFRRLCSGFHQDIPLRGSSIEKVVEEAIQFQFGQKAESIAALKAFLDDVLSDRYSGEQINRLWNTCPADIYVTGPQGGIELSRAVRRRLDLPPFGQK